MGGKEEALLANTHLTYYLIRHYFKGGEGRLLPHPWI